MLLQSSIPDTSVYMIAGYGMFAVIMCIYLASFFIRRRNLEQDLKTLESIQSEARSPAAKVPPIVKADARPRTARPSSRQAKPARKRATRKR